MKWLPVAVLMLSVPAMAAEDLRLLEYEPRTDQERLWGAIMYLLGVAMPSAPGEYLHTTADFEEYRRGARF